MSDLFTVEGSKGNKRLHRVFEDLTIKQRFAVRKIIKSLFYNAHHSNLELSKITEFSTPTVSGLLDGLIGHNVVEVRGQGSSNGGRKPLRYGLNPRFGYILAISVDQYYTRMAMLDLQGKPAYEAKVVRLKLQDDESVVVELCRMIHEYIADSGVSRSSILGAGIGIPGLIDVKKGINYTFFSEADGGIRSVFSKELGLPVFIGNDSDVLALGEYQLGEAREKQNVLVVNAGWGVGLGMILNGALFQGHSGFAGEFSHIPINENGILCSCGKRGCLETEASATTLARLAKEGIREGKLSSLSNMLNEDLEKLEAELVIEAANLGDQYSVQILAQVGYSLGKGLATLIHLLNPELIVISGRLAKADHYILNPIEHGLNKYSIPRLRKCTRVVVSELKDQASMMGCAFLVIENLLQLNYEMAAVESVG